jgi:putative phosphoribosyl transferase
MSERFLDRRHAGRVLANRLKGYSNRADVVVLGLPRGGVPVAREVATVLHAPLDVFVVRKLGVPRREELAMGAIASGGVRVLNDDVVRSFRIGSDVIERSAQAEGVELARREAVYRSGRPPLDLRGKVVIVVDDGLATGSTMRAAVQAVRHHEPAEVVVAVPVGARSVCDSLSSLADAVECSLTPKNLHAVGLWYEDFTQTTDDEITGLLASDDD